MKKAFTPNLSQEAINELDRKRWRADTSTNNTNPDEIICKKPWLKPDNTHKSEVSMSAVPGGSIVGQTSLSMKSATIGGSSTGTGGGFDKSKDKDNSKIEDLLNYEVKEHGKIPTPAEEEAECKDDADKSVGMNHNQTIKVKKSQTAEAIDLLKAVHKLSGKPVPRFFLNQRENPASVEVPHEVRRAAERHNVVETDRRLSGDLKDRASLKPVSAAAKQHVKTNFAHFTSKQHRQAAAEHTAAVPHQPRNSSGKVGHAAMAQAHTNAANTKSSGGVSGGPTEKSVDEDTLVEKAMTSRSIPQLRPLVYDPSQTTNRALAVPYTPIDLSDPAYQGTVRTQETYKSCMIHGIMFKSDRECHPCSISKSLTCKNCGSDMQKTAGGGLVCSAGH